MENDYECPRCHNVFPSSNKIMHDVRCTEQKPLPNDKNNIEAPKPIENKEENVPQLSQLVNIIDFQDDNINKMNNNSNNDNNFNLNFDNKKNNINDNNNFNFDLNDNNNNNNNNINNNYDFNFNFDNNNNNLNKNNDNNDNNKNNLDFNFNFDNNNDNLNKNNDNNDNNFDFNFNFDNNNSNNNNNNNNKKFDNINAFNDIINEPQEDEFPKVFECEICHEMFMEKERKDHMLCHNLENDDKKNLLRISRIDVEEQKRIEKQIEKNNRRKLINQHRINQNNFNNNNNIDDINNISNGNNINNNRRNYNNNYIHHNNRSNPNNNDNINVNQRMDIRIRERGPNVEVHVVQNNPNNERPNIQRYHRRYRNTNNNINNNNINNNNFPNFNRVHPINPISFNRPRPIQRFVPFQDINNRFSIRAIFENMYENLDNSVRATDKQILKNLPETQIEDVSKLDPEKKNCVICLEDFKNKDKAIILPCIHLFHKTCINNWLKKKNTCPICKFKLTGSNIDSQNNNFQ